APDFGVVRISHRCAVFVCRFALFATVERQLAYDFGTRPLVGQFLIHIDKKEAPETAPAPFSLIWVKFSRALSARELLRERPACALLRSASGWLRPARPPPCARRRRSSPLPFASPLRRFFQLDPRVSPRNEGCTRLSPPPAPMLATSLLSF